jgi:hypothetical protein
MFSRSGVVRRLRIKVIAKPDSCRGRYDSVMLHQLHHATYMYKRFRALTRELAYAVNL